MRKGILLLFILLSITTYSQDREGDSLALVQIYNDLNGDEWVGIDNWLSSAPMEDWEGIQLSNDRVVTVELKNADAEGIFPMSILNLSELRTLEIRKATISGALPSELVQLEDLDRLVLSNCGMTGDLPPIFDQMTSLSTLVLDNNSFTGPLPDIHDNYFLIYIDNNQFSGAVPPSWANKSMRAVQIQGNQLEGSIDIFSTWSSWGNMNLSDNNWDEASFPEWVDDNEALERFDCENCNLTGDLPTSLDFSNCPKYRNMQLSYNNLSGDISLLFNGLESEEDLYLRARENNFSGEFPAHKMRLFFRIDISSNRYESMSDFDNPILEAIDLNYNNFNFTTLEPVKEYIALDSIIGVNYGDQNPLLGLDSIYITSQSALTLEAGDQTEGTTYQWYRNNQIIEGETNHDLELQLNTNSDGGSFYCRMSHEDYPELELRRNVVFVNVDLSTSTANIEAHDIQIYPNPASSYLKVELPDGLHNGDFQIKSIDGLNIKTGILHDKMNIDISDLSKGIYILNLRKDSINVSKKFTKF